MPSISKRLKFFIPFTLLYDDEKVVDQQDSKVVAIVAHMLQNNLTEEQIDAIVAILKAE